MNRLPLDVYSRGTVSVDGGWGLGGRILENPHRGVLVHRVTRPLRGSVSCGSGWSVPYVSIQLTLAQSASSLVQYRVR